MTVSSAWQCRSASQSTMSSPRGNRGTRGRHARVGDAPARGCAIDRGGTLTAQWWWPSVAFPAAEASTMEAGPAGTDNTRGHAARRQSPTNGSLRPLPAGKGAGQSLRRRYKDGQYRRHSPALPGRRPRAPVKPLPPPGRLPTGPTTVGRARPIHSFRPRGSIVGGVHHHRPGPRHRGSATSAPARAPLPPRHCRHQSPHTTAHCARSRGGRGRPTVEQPLAQWRRACQECLCPLRQRLRARPRLQYAVPLKDRGRVEAPQKGLIPSSPRASHGPRPTFAPPPESTRV